MTIEALLLDFGGVCLVHPNEMHDRTEAMLGLEPRSLGWLGASDPSTDELWRQIMAGTLTEPEYWDIRAAELSELAARSMSRSDYFTMLYDPPTPAMIRPQATEVVLAAKRAGYGMSILTNDLGSFQGPQWQHKVPFFELADHVVDCSGTGILKPDPRAYARAARVVGVSLDRMLFVDDQPKNVEGAIAVGLEAMFFDVGDAAGSWAAVARRLGLESATAT